MKTIKAMFVLILAVLAANVSSASGKVKFDKTANDSEVALAATSFVEMSSIEVNVKDGFGEVLYESNLTAPASTFNKKFDFSSMENGKYWFKVKINNETTVNKFEVKNGNVEMLEVRKSSEPHFVYKDNQLKLTLLNHQNEDVTMYVYDDSRKIMYKKELGTQFAIHHGVDLSKLQRGNYEVVLVNDRDIFDIDVRVD